MIQLAKKCGVCHRKVDDFTVRVDRYGQEIITLCKDCKE